MKTLSGLVISLLTGALIRVIPVVAVGAGVLLLAPPTLVAIGSLQRAASGGFDLLAGQVLGLDPRPSYRTISVLDGRTLASEIAVRRQTIGAGSLVMRVGH